MKYYLAPMEGLTGYIYRNAYHACYHAMDKYFTPFLSPKANSKLSLRELNDILPEHNQGMYVVPQILTNQAEDFIRTAKELQEYGYSEINLNLGCPSGTVVSKHKGAGFLGRPDSLDRFLDEVCGKMDEMGMEVSVKTRLGLISPDEFTGLLEIYNRYPLKELILHPRVRTDYYKNTPNMPAFRGGFDGSRSPVCYNGDIFTAAAYGRVSEKYSDIRHWMIGRGLLSNPALCREIRGGDCASREELADYYHTMRDEYEVRLQGNKKVVFLMKEFWHYISWILSEEDRQEIDVLMHLRDGAEFFRKAEEIAANCTVVKGQGVSF